MPTTALKLCLFMVLLFHSVEPLSPPGNPLVVPTEVDEVDTDIGLKGPSSGGITKVGDDHDICQTETCVARATTMLLALNTSVDPCDDFFQYACGNWITVHPIPPVDARWTTLQQMHQQLNGKLRDLMRLRIDENSSARQKAKEAYDACMDLEKIEKFGSVPFISNLASVIGSWPILNNSWHSNQFEALDMYMKFSKAGGAYLGSIGGYADSNDPRSNLLNFDEMSLGLESKKMYYQSSKHTVREAYMALMKNLTKLLSEDLNVTLPSSLDQQLKDIMDFETSIAKISYTSEQRRDPGKVTHQMTLNNFIDNYFNRTFQKIAFVEALRGIPMNASVSAAIQLNMTVNVVHPAYFQALDGIWFNRLNGPDNATTGNRFLAIYLGWRMLLHAAPFLSKRYRDAAFEFKKVYSGVRKQHPRSATCIEFASKSMPLAVGSLYVQEYFGPDSKAKLLEMTINIKSAFRTILENTEWMDEKTRERALAKLLAINDYLGYPDFLLLDVPRLDRFYESYNITDVHYLNDQNFDKERTTESFGLLLKPNLRNLDETSNPTKINAHYSRSTNVIAIYAGIAQPSLFHKDYPDYLNYAALGTVLGHEISHGFDDRGSQYDEEGKLSIWWTNASRAKFEGRAQAIVKQYSGFETDAGFVNGELTVGENIADNAGIKEAFMAYKQYLGRLNGTKPTLLPGLQNFTLDQVFFLASAQLWCGYYRPEYLKNVALLSVHSPIQFRVNGPMSNLPEFAQTYNCSFGSNMNPLNKAGVW